MQLIDLQFKAIHRFVAALQVVMVQFLVVMIFGHSAFQGVDVFFIIYLFYFFLISRVLLSNL